MMDIEADTKQFVIAYIAHVERTGGGVAAAPKWAQDRMDNLATGELSFPDTAELCAYTREHHNPVLLIKYLRGIDRKAPVLHPELAALTADALEHGWKKMKFTAIDSAYLLGLRKNIKAMLKPTCQDAKLLNARLSGKKLHGANRRAAKIIDDAQRAAVHLASALGVNSEKADAANSIAAHLLGLPSGKDFKRLAYKRTGRNKKG